MKNIKYPKILWSQLKKLNAVKFINTMYVWIFIVPILVKALENIGDTAKLTIFSHTFIAQLSLPFSWVLFYFSAMSFAAANIIFQIWCPNIIKEQSDYSEFRGANKGVEHLDHYLFEVGMNWEGLRKRIENQDEYFSEVAEVSNPRADDGELRKRFWAVYSQANSWRPIPKYLALALYLTGGALISYVFWQNAEFVINYVAGT